MTKQTELHPSIVAKIALYNRWIDAAKAADPFVRMLNTTRDKLEVKSDEVLFNGSNVLLRVYPNTYKEAKDTLKTLAAEYGKYRIVECPSIGVIDYDFSNSICVSFCFLPTSSCKFVKITDEEVTELHPVYAFQCNGQDSEAPNGGIQ